MSRYLPLLLCVGSVLASKAASLLASVSISASPQHRPVCHLLARSAQRQMCHQVIHLCHRVIKRIDQCLAECLNYYLCWRVSQNFDHSCGPYIAKYVTNCVRLSSCYHIIQRVDQCLGLKIAQRARKCHPLACISNSVSASVLACIKYCFALVVSVCLPGARPFYGLVCHYVSRALLLLLSQPSYRPEPSFDMASCVANYLCVLL